MSENTVEERAKKLVDPREFTKYSDYQLALAQKVQELLLSDAQSERSTQEMEAKRAQQRDAIRHEMDREIEQASGGRATGHTTDEEAEAELRRQERETRDMASLYR